MGSMVRFMMGMMFCLWIAYGALRKHAGALAGEENTGPLFALGFLVAAWVAYVWGYCVVSGVRARWSCRG